MSSQFRLDTKARTAAGTRYSRNLRRQGFIPAVMYGAGKPTTHLMIKHHHIAYQLETEGFTSAIIDVSVDGKSEQAILRSVQHHPYKPYVLHIDLQRVSAKEKLHLNMPLNFIGEDECVGTHIEGGMLSKLINEVEISCLPKDLPESLELDISELALGQSKHLSEIGLPEGVELTALAHGGEDLAVVTVTTIREEVIEDEEDVDDEAIESEEGDDAGDSTSEEDPSQS